MKKFDCIFINGDSYSASSNDRLVYGDFLSKELGIPVINLARSGSNNQRILRSSIEELNALKLSYQTPLILIGWSFIRRLEVWYYGNNQKVLNRIPDQRPALGLHLQPRLVTLDMLLSEKEATLEQKALVNEDLFVHKSLIDFYTNLYMFSHLLAHMSLEYFWFSAARNTDCPTHCFPYIDSLNQVNWVKNNKNIFGLHDFCILDWAKQNDPDCHPVTGHLSESGHEKFAKFILEKIRLVHN
jgi:hypothetical protein